ncbi:hypothetical protein [Staphylococcus durrellii]|nr:hypothetical protein [Staphylococcus durrellii]MBF7017531.1 hypothetical protein [Staphylococcus durrellii]
MGNKDVNIQCYKLLAECNPINFKDHSQGDAEDYVIMNNVYQQGGLNK